jgi:pentafunctional AROM polypeptide
MPLSIAPTGLRGGRIELAASLSSQYVSAVLLAAPYAQTPIELELVGGEVVSQLYIDMTIALMADFGVHVERLGPTTYRIPLGTYVSPSAFAIESDASSATYPLALAAITGTTCTLANIGTASLQGDARFAKDVLEPMGCTVRQTATSTTVTGPAVGSLRALSAIDMEPMTDAFMTAAVLAAVARGTTRITGIANQRVKECNRIEAMRVQLAKFGVVVRELPDGIEVDGRPPAELGRPVANAAGVEQPAPLSEGERDIEIFCYDDHRIAMAFSVLAAVPGGPGCVIEDRRCVEKTWPSWWDDLSAKLGGVLVDGVEPHVTSSTAAPASSRYPPDATIVLIGMRGAGKSYTGAIGAAALGRPLIDADLFFTEKEGVDIRDFVHANSWPAFRERELAHLEELLSTRPTGHIIAMGGGIVETPAAKRLLEQYAARSGPVVNVMRNIDEIVAYLGIDPTRPSLGEPIEEIAARRAPLFTACSTFDFHSYTTDDARGSRESIARFFRFVTGQAANQVDLSRGRSYFLPLTYPNVRPALPLLDELTVGVDAIELRVDLLATDGKAPVGPQVPPLTYVAAQLAAVRQRSSLPIVFTVRTASQGGFFPDAAEKEYFELLHQAVRWGCEYIDLQLGVDIERSKRFVGSRGASLVIASYHDWSGTLKWDSPTMRSLYAQLVPLGDVVKLVTKATSLSDNYAMMAFRDSVPATKPLMTLNMGSDGQLSRILNPVLSPVTHSLLPPSAPGQLSFAQTQTALYLLGQLPKKRFALLGSPIGHSKSPLIQNTGFQMLGLPYTYGLLEATEADEKVVEFLQAADFGGASGAWPTSELWLDGPPTPVRTVTIPMKLKIMPLLDEITPEAQLIGAVNTVLVRHDGDGSRKLIGTNTGAPCSLCSAASLE